ncbi:hypothetical protein KJ782_06940 [Patescibacteria group bacterium]|nr:hypothetical protein [Patescibacteria group bacterium]
MTKTTPMGQLLINSVLPDNHQISGRTTKKSLMALLTSMANEDPAKYVKVVTDLKQVGDAVATNMGITVGLDDIEPEYGPRDKILKGALAKIKGIKDPKERVKLIDATQQKLMESVATHPGQMTLMAVSGGRGSLAQLMRTVASPVAVVDSKQNTQPWLISRSYAEGLKAPDLWAELNESRRNAVETNLSVTVPGEMGKLFVNTMSDQLVTMADCGTKNGILLHSDDPHIHDRYVARTGELITSSVADRLRKEGKDVLVRSPMTCEAPHGVCQKCQGLNERGQDHTVGTNVGMRAAQAIAEPLTQLSLNAKHAVRTTGAGSATLSGLAGIRQLTSIPQSFTNKATLATRTGHVTGVKEAPQGGNYVFVDDKQHYLPPALGVSVKVGDRVEQGDMLSTGVPKPDEIVQYKGLGAGRAYLVDALHTAYGTSGINLDKRHLELLAKADLNYVRIMDTDNGDLGVMRGDIVDYNLFRASLANHTKVVPLGDALGETLSDNVLHHTAGTRVTQGLASELRRKGITHVPIGPRVPLHEMIMKPIARTPLLNPDVFARLGHRNLKESLLEGAATGEHADIHSTHPVPALVFGAEFGKGPGGRY